MPSIQPVVLKASPRLTLPILPEGTCTPGRAFPQGFQQLVWLGVRDSTRLPSSEHYLSRIQQLHVASKAPEHLKAHTPHDASCMCVTHCVMGAMCTLHEQPSCAQRPWRSDDQPVPAYHWQHHCQWYLK